jgi:hypothetical protein
MTGRKRSRRGGRRTGIAVAATLTYLLGLGAASADESASDRDANAVITWNIHAQTAIGDVAGQEPWVQSRSFAMVQGAVYDAVNAIAGAPYEPYLVVPHADGTESAEAAIATAAHRVLVVLFPDQRSALRAQYDSFLAGIRAGRAKQRGIAVGEQAAAAMIAARENDGAFEGETWAVGAGPGEWRPTLPLFASRGAWVAHHAPFVIPSASMFRTAGPPALTSRAYARDLEEVKRIGSARSTIRTADQTEGALWWHDFRITQWEINRQVARHQRLDLVKTARLLAMVNVATADAHIACFDEKATWGFWRPLTAIRLADTDGNSMTTADRDWTPLVSTSPTPEYASGHSCATGAAMTALAQLFGRDDIPFSAFSPASGTRRRFARFSQAIAEVIEARIWAGIHFRTSDVQGAKIGVQVGRHVFRNAFRSAR